MRDLRLYDYAASANCYKVRLLLAQLGVPYERVPVDIFAGATLTEEYAAKNPARTTPVLELHPGEFLPESNAILLYLAEGTDLLPADHGERAQAWRWLFFEQADVVPTIGGLRFRLRTGRLHPEGEEAARRRRGSTETLRVLDHHLHDRTFAVGERYTVADVALYGYVHVADEAGLELGRYPAVRRWLARVASQPGYVHDLEPYPANAMADSGTSIYG